MELSRMSSFLRRVLVADATTSGACGLLMVFGSGFLERLLGVPAAVLVSAGILLFPFAGFVAYLATREHLHRPSLWAVIACNALWAIDSIALLLFGWLEPTLLGNAFVVAQALVVGAFAELQYFGLRRSVATARGTGA